MKEVVISSKKRVELWSPLSSVFKQLFLIKLFVKRDFNTFYKQTILGPFWFFIQPIFTMLVYVLIFGKIAGIGTGAIPQSLFYLSGIICWTYFSENTIKISTTFLENAHIFGKVYFPRIIMPIANMLTAYIKLFVQLGLLIVVLIFQGFEHLNHSWTILFFPVVFVFLGILSTGFGIMTSALTTKYRDLKFLVQFGVQLLMYLSAVIWPFSSLEKMLGEKYALIYELSYYNPITHFIEGFRYFLFGEGFFDVAWFSYSCIFSVGLFLGATAIFTRVEKDFMDTI